MKIEIKKKKEKLNENDIRKWKKTVRVSENEMKIISEKMKNFDVSFGELARNLLLDLKVNTILENEMITELRKIGTNVNQIARLMNAGREDVIDIASSWANIEKEINERILNRGR